MPKTNTMKSLLNYFDLNPRAGVETRSPAESDMLQAVKPARKKEPPPKMSFGEQILMYCGLVLGVIFSSAVTQFKTNTAKPITVTGATIVVSLVIGFIVMPAAFEKLQVKTDSPLLVRIGLFVQHGVFWNVLFAAAGKALGK